MGWCFFGKDTKVDRRLVIWRYIARHVVAAKLATGARSCYAIGGTAPLAHELPPLVRVPYPMTPS